MVLIFRVYQEMDLRSLPPIKTPFCMKYFYSRLPLSLLLAALILPTSPLYAQLTARTVLQNMVDAYEARTQGITDFTVTSDAFTSYHKKYTDNGRSFFKTTTRLNGMQNAMVGTMTTQMGTDNPHRMQAMLTEHATYAGTDMLNGNRAHILELTDFASFDNNLDASEGTPKRVRYFIDAQTWVPLQIDMDMEADMNGSRKAVSPQVRFENYRDVEGLLYPFQTVVHMRGMELDTSISPEQLAEARAAIANLDERLKDLPEDQRKQIKQMMKPQIERFEKMIANGDEGLAMTYTVTNIQVNTGLSDDLFENNP